MMYISGWLETRWEEPKRPGRPPRHTYRLTAEGVREAGSTLQIGESILFLAAYLAVLLVTTFLTVRTRDVTS